MLVSAELASVSLLLRTLVSGDGGSESGCSARITSTTPLVLGRLTSLDFTKSDDVEEVFDTSLLEDDEAAYSVDADFGECEDEDEELTSTELPVAGDGLPDFFLLMECDLEIASSDSSRGECCREGKIFCYYYYEK